MIYLGADHNGFVLKETLKPYLVRRGFAVRDCGAPVYRKSDDYVDFASAVAKSIRAGDLGILVCGSGHGMTIAANKYPGIRAILAHDPQSSRYGRRDDHANILVLAAWQLDNRQAISIVRAFIKQKPGKAERYLRRLRKVRQLER